MDRDEHQRERMRFWDAVCVAGAAVPTTPFPQIDADALLAERDKRFPAPAAVEVAPVPTDATEYDNEAYSCGWNDGHAEGVTHGTAHHAAELASLREKARLWDAVASWKVILSSNGTTFYATWKVNPGYAATPHFTTAAEAVQAAIDAGALK